MAEAAPPTSPKLALKRSGPVVIGTGYTLSSAVMGDERRINILLPDAYDDPALATRHYPVLYLLDGGDGFQDFANIPRWCSAARAGAEVSGR